MRTDTSSPTRARRGAGATRGWAALLELRPLEGLVDSRDLCVQRRRSLAGRAADLIAIEPADVYGAAA